MGFRAITKEIITIFFFLLILVLLPIVIVCVIVPVFLARFLVFCCSRLFGPKGIQGMIGQLCGLHAVDNLTQKPLGNLLVALYLESDKFDLVTLRENFKSKVLNKRNSRGRLMYPELQQILCEFMGYSFWKWDPNFLAEDHCSIYQPKEGEVIDEAGLLKIRQELVLKPWKPNMPPWECIIVEKLQSTEYPNAVVLFFLAHHTLMDGYSIINILVEDYTTISLEKVIAKPVGYGSNAFGMITRAVERIGFPIKAIYEFSGELSRGSDYNDWHRPNVTLNRNGCFSYANSVTVNYIKEIKNSHGVSFTAVLLAAICAGVRNGMKRESVQIPDYVDSFTVFPMPGHPKKLTNYL